MLCPDCKRNTFKPEYKNAPEPYILDAPYDRYAASRKHLTPAYFICSACKAVYYVQARETEEQAYWRIIRDHTK